MVMTMQALSWRLFEGYPLKMMLRRMWVKVVSLVPHPGESTSGSRCMHKHPLRSNMSIFRCWEILRCPKILASTVYKSSSRDHHFGPFSFAHGLTNRDNRDPVFPISHTYLMGNIMAILAQVGVAAFFTAQLPLASVKAWLWEEYDWK